MDIARETIELGDCDRTAQRARLGERRRQLGPAVQRVAPLASFNLDKLGDDLEALTRREPVLEPLAAPRCQGRTGLAGWC